MARALFVNETYLKNNTPFYSNVDPKDFRAHLLTAQDIDIQKILGYKLYNELQDAVIVVAGGGEMTQDQADLIELIRPSLAWYAYASSLPYNFVKSTNKGLVQKNSDNSTAIDEKIMFTLANDARNKGQSYAEVVRDFLMNPININKFPSYIIIDPYNMKPNKGSQYSSAIYTPKRSWIPYYYGGCCCGGGCESGCNGCR